MCLNPYSQTFAPMKSCCFLFVAFCSALFFNRPTLCAQSGACYVRLKDASGHEPSAAQVEALEQAAAALCAVFDSAGFGGQFKVYDFSGFTCTTRARRAATRSRLPEGGGGGGAFAVLFSVWEGGE